ncbi:MAG: copper-binding protein [Terriglobia bacterium]
MKRVALVALAMGLLTAGCAREAEPPAETGPPSWTVKGKIVSVDAEAGRATVDHEDIPGLMAGMQMTFAVSDAALLEGLAEGDAVEFTLEQLGGGLTITEIRKIDESELGQATTTYEGTGTVEVVNRPMAAIQLKVDGIEGVIPAGEKLVIPVRPSSLLEGIEDDDRVEFVLERKGDGLTAVALKKTDN